MGLDMYLEGEKFLWTDYERPRRNRENGYKVSRKILDLGYWRKEWGLHEHILRLSPKGEDCQRFSLTVEEFKQLIDDMENDVIEDYKADKEDLKMMRKALKWVETEEDKVSRTIYYSSSW